MKKLFFAILFASVLYPCVLKSQEITGLSGFSLFLDPGHSQKENQGLYNYSEAEKTLRVGLELRRLLLTYTDIDTVYISRTNDLQQVSLSQRTDLANSLAADFYHSIHSNAGSNTTNNTLFLHGGWRSNGNTVEKNPIGGKEMGDIMEIVHTAAMRIPTIGNWADRNFYLGSTATNHTNQWPYLHVNRETNMASVLSESGFHTNPAQQQRNLNAEWKKLEAQSFFWSILEYLEVNRSPVGIAAGYVTNADINQPLNGATVTVGDSIYTTDTFESLFNQYSSTPGELKNGFYYIKDLMSGANQLVTTAEGFYPDTMAIVIDSNDFTFNDISLVSNIPPNIISSSLGDDNRINPGEDLVLYFSRPMNRDSVENALSILPEASFSITWNSASTELSLTTSTFNFESSYSLSIDSTAEDKSIYKHKFDGNNNGISGGNYTISFETGQEDIIAPVISDIYPTNTKLNELWPIASATFNEHLDTTNIDNSTIQIRLGTYTVPGTIVYYTVGKKSVLNFFPSERLEPNKNYKLQFSGSISDTSGNSIGSNVLRTFPTGNFDYLNEIEIDDYEGNLNAWWQPAQSGSTTGYTPEETNLSATNEIVNLLTGSTQAMYLSYGWDTTSAENLIREYRSIGLPKFSNQRLLQSYVFGDGSGNKFRFMLRDGSSQLEGSSWYNVDWFGWKLVTWDLAQDSVIAWVNGNGVLNGNVYVDSYQLTYTEGSPTTGFIVFDDFRAVETGIPTFTEERDSDLPSKIQLSQNYPNPFNPSTNINFGLPEAGDVSLKVYDMLGREVATLFEGVKSQGYHSIQFNASALASGIYFYRLITNSGSISRKMTLLK